MEMSGDIDTSIRTVNSTCSSVQSAHSVVSRSQRIMKIRTIKESLRPQTEEELHVIRMRRKLRVLGPSDDDNITMSNINLDSLLSVRFDKVQIRDYPVILGDNPATTEGPPLTIDWVYDIADEFSVDEYETTRPPRRGTVEMNIPHDMRIDMLKRCGFTSKEILQRIKEVSDARNARLVTKQMLYRSDTNERLENISRGFGNLFSRKKKKERKLLKSSSLYLNSKLNEANDQAAQEQKILATLISERKSESIDT